MKKKTVGIGVIGGGTVGRHFVRAMAAKQEFLQKKTGLRFEVVKVYDKDRQKRKLFPGLFVGSAGAILTDPGIDIVVELIGGVQDAYRYVCQAIGNNKSVVTANKALLSEKGPEIFRRARRQKLYVGFEGSVGGAIPVIKTIRESFVGNRITRVLAILNGTTNFILSQMSHQAMEFDQALTVAREKGYAEANPRLDLSGLDTAHKMSILTTFLFHRNISWRDIPVEGIEKLERMEIQFAREFGYRIKLLAIAARLDNQLEIRVHPVLLPEDHLLSLVEGVHNAVYLEGDLIGQSLLFGEGAGGAAAASSVVSDVVEIGMKLQAPEYQLLRFPEDKTLKIRPLDEVRTKYYFRFTALDKPGVLAKIAEVLGKNGISIASVIQKKENPEKAVPIVMLTHQARERMVRKALSVIDRFREIRRPTVAIRLEE